ncbi:hypothetical protein C7H19_24150 [Aphanothece hegewaldii CCALA 016]|uniref:Uncharacterized protein n=1 Tax=Aphanothece hegewaldii CCALA 016 TaxID=2107694 RepID=A0A2T1LQU9_9CHRO|nr:hypothetical protein [Aphanothece hegewaldii]PSF30022.1 hypothetical protein C7H19_24150 [Aphanothece hegewaldii CCALA 016]
MLSQYPALETAAEILKENRMSCQDMSLEAIALVIENHLEEIIEDALNNPEYFFRDTYRFWRDLEAVKALGRGKNLD